MAMEAAALASIRLVPGGSCPCCGGRVRPVRGDRRFNLIDGMIVVGAVAVATAFVRSLLDFKHPTPVWIAGLTVVFVGLVVGTPTLLALRLRTPRPTLRRLARQPGFAATLAGSTVLALGLLVFGLLALVRGAKRSMTAPPGGWPADDGWWVDVIIHFAVVIGPAVIVAWLLLAVNGRRRPDPGWLDRLGRVVGVLWIVVFVINGVARLASLSR